MGEDAGTEPDPLEMARSSRVMTRKRDIGASVRAKIKTAGIAPAVFVCGSTAYSTDRSRAYLKRTFLIS